MSAEVDEAWPVMSDAGAEIERLRVLNSELLSALLAFRSITKEARMAWDIAPDGMRAGKLLIALSGKLPGYRADIDAIHVALAKARATGAA